MRRLSLHFLVSMNFLDTRLSNYFHRPKQLIVNHLLPDNGIVQHKRYGFRKGLANVCALQTLQRPVTSTNTII